MHVVRQLDLQLARHAERLAVDELGLQYLVGRPAQPRDRGARGKRQEGRAAGEGRIRHAGVPADGHRRVSHGSRQRVHESDIDDLLEALDIRRSLSRKGNPYDNAVIESTNRILKKELVYRRAFTDLGQLRRELNSYVRWRNEERMHSTLGYMSPVELRNAGLSL